VPLRRDIGTLEHYDAQGAEVVGNRLRRLGTAEELPQCHRWADL
jgi:hypothetical protein